MYVLVKLVWLMDTLGPDGFDMNLMRVRIIDRNAETVFVENGNKPDLLAVPFNQVWNLTLGDA